MLEKEKNTQENNFPKNRPSCNMFSILFTAFAQTFIWNILSDEEDRTRYYIQCLFAVFGSYENNLSDLVVKGFFIYLSVKKKIINFFIYASFCCKHLDMRYRLQKENNTKIKTARFFTVSVHNKKRLNATMQQFDGRGD